jgi:hypothetical protein
MEVYSKNELMKKKNALAKSIIVTLIVFNPVLLLVMSKNFVFTMAVIMLTTVIGFILLCLSGYQRLKIWAANIAVILGIALYSELLFRELCPQLNIPNIYGIHGKFYFNKPNLNKTFRDDEFISLYKTNSQGYRTDELTATENVDSCDWLFIGDSYTQGAQVDYDKLFSTLVYRNFPDKIIVNAGMSGAGLYEELNYYKSMGSKLKPKRIYLQIGAFNDFYNVRERNAGISEYLMSYSDLYRFLEYNIIDSPTLPLGRWTEPFFPDRTNNIDFNIFFKEESDRKKQDIDAISTVIREYKSCTDRTDAELVIVLVPSKEQVSNRLLYEVMSKYNISVNDLDMQKPNKLMSEICTKYGIRLIDLYSDFANADYLPFFERDEHLNEYGHELIAQRISAEFKDEAKQYEYYSQSNSYERYPTLYNDGMSVLYQHQDNLKHYIASSNIMRSRNNELWQSVQELIHPMMSANGEYLLFTEGDQNNGDTNVILHNLSNQSSVRVNPDGCKGAIATFSHDSQMIVYPQWSGNNLVTTIAIYDISQGKELTKIATSGECWRPIFSQDDSAIYYIERDGSSKKFVVMKHDIANKKSSVILNTGYEIWDIALSPSGNYIAYAGNKSGNWDIFLYDLQRKQIQQITNSLGNEWDPTFGCTDDDLWFAGVFGFNNGIYHKKLSL